MEVSTLGSHQMPVPGQLRTKIRAESSSNGSSRPGPHNSSTLSSHQISRWSKHEELRTFQVSWEGYFYFPVVLLGLVRYSWYLDEWVYYFSYSWGMASGGFQRAANFVFVLTSDFYLGSGSHGLCLPE